MWIWPRAFSSSFWELERSFIIFCWALYLFVVIFFPMKLWYRRSRSQNEASAAWAASSVSGCSPLAS